MQLQPLRCLALLLMWSSCFVVAASSAEQVAELSLEMPAGELLFVVNDIYSDSLQQQRNTLTSQRQQRAEFCFRQAREACEAGDVAAALRGATRAVFFNPDHEAARRVLGYRRVGDHWAGAYAARRIETGEVWHPQFGWIAAEDVSRYEAGERRSGNRWISAEEDARRHATIDNAWQIRTDHFRVVTNHDREDASRLAIRLEVLYQLWRQLFGGFYLEPSQLLKRFEGNESSGYRSKPFHVVYHQSRKEYNMALRRLQPRIDITLGIYFDTTRTSHFFAGPDQDPGTIYHEAVHQLFQESGRSARDVAKHRNAWILEGVACYFESLQAHQDPSTGPFYTLGTPEAGRLPAARHRRLVDDYYVPLAELSALGMTDLQQRDDLPRLYSQSAGLATFLIDGRQGQYRPALVKLLQLIYTGHDRPTSLQELTGQDFADLDRQYQEFIAKLPSPSAEGQAE